MNSRLDEFFSVAREMRALQKRFFAGDKSVVGRAKWCERRFDALLEQLRPEREETGLFDVDVADTRSKVDATQAKSTTD